MTRTKPADPTSGNEGQAVINRLHNRSMNVYEVESLSQEETRRRLRGIQTVRWYHQLWVKNEKTILDLEKRLENHLEPTEPYPKRLPGWEKRKRPR